VLVASGIKSSITPEVLRWARESINMDPAEAAERIGTGRNRLIDWEEGIEAPSLQQMRKAREVYKRPLAAFYLPEPSRFQIPKNDFRRLPESELRPISASLLLELRRMHYLRETAVSLMGETDDPIQNLIGSIDTSAPAAQVASRVREVLSISLDQQTAWRGGPGGRVRVRGGGDWRRAAGAGGRERGGRRGDGGVDPVQIPSGRPPVRVEPLHGYDDDSIPDDDVQFDRAPERAGVADADVRARLIRRFHGEMQMLFDVNPTAAYSRALNKVRDDPVGYGAVPRRGRDFANAN
jgi:transcriptional regulator with XRE-family HTH domain